MYLQSGNDWAKHTTSNFFCLVSLHSTGIIFLMANCFCVNDVEKIRPWKIWLSSHYVRRLEPFWTLLIGDKISLRTAIHRFSRKKIVTSTRWYVLDRRAIIMLTRRITPIIRKAPNKNLANVTEALSTESIGSNSAIPSRDQQRCLNMAHQLKERNWRWILTKVRMRPETTVKNCCQKSFNRFLRAIIRTFVGIHHRRIRTTFKD